jgi:hypothetical protein
MLLVPAQSNRLDDAGFLAKQAAVGSNVVNGVRNFAGINEILIGQGNKSTDFRQSKDITTHWFYWCIRSQKLCILCINAYCDQGCIYCVLESFLRWRKDFASIAQ